MIYTKHLTKFENNDKDIINSLSKCTVAKGQAWEKQRIMFCLFIFASQGILFWCSSCLMLLKFSSYFWCPLNFSKSAMHILFQKCVLNRKTKCFHDNTTRSIEKWTSNEMDSLNQFHLAE